MQHKRQRHNDFTTTGNSQSEEPYLTEDDKSQSAMPPQRIQQQAVYSNISDSDKDKLESISKYLEERYFGKLEGSLLWMKNILKKIQKNGWQQYDFQSIEQFFKKLQETDTLTAFLLHIDQGKMQTQYVYKNVFLKFLPKIKEQTEISKIEKEVKQLFLHYKYDLEDFKQQLKSKFPHEYNSTKLLHQQYKKEKEKRNTTSNNNNNINNNNNNNNNDNNHNNNDNRLDQSHNSISTSSQRSFITKISIPLANPSQDTLLKQSTKDKQNQAIGQNLNSKRKYQFEEDENHLKSQNKNQFYNKNSIQSADNSNSVPSVKRNQILKNENKPALVKKVQKQNILPSNRDNLNNKVDGKKQCLGEKARQEEIKLLEDELKYFVELGNQQQQQLKDQQKYFGEYFEKSRKVLEEHASLLNSFQIEQGNALFSYLLKKESQQRLMQYQQFQQIQQQQMSQQQQLGLQNNMNNNKR